MQRYLNRYLPMDIAIIEVEEVPERFHAQLNATSKTYVYRMTIDDVRAHDHTNCSKFHLQIALRFCFDLSFGCQSDDLIRVMSFFKKAFCASGGEIHRKFMNCPALFLVISAVLCYTAF